MSRKVFTADEVLTAEDVNSFLMDQTVMSFAGTAARGSAIPVPVEGMTSYLEDIDDIRTYNGTSWVSPFGLTLVKAQVVGTAVTSVVVNDAFSAAYDNYKIILDGGTTNTPGNIGLVFGASATGYYAGGTFISYSGGGVSAVQDNNATSFTRAGRGGTNAHVNLEVFSPFLAKQTVFNANYVTTGTASGSGYNSGYHDSAVSYTAFTLVASAGMNLTGGTIRVYGYRN
jgi:hypothetical protein